MAAAPKLSRSEVQAAVDVTIGKSELRNAGDREGAKATLESCWLASGMLQDVSAFLDVGRQIQEDSQQLEEEALAAAMGRRLPELQEHVAKGLRSLEQIAKRLLASISEGKALPAEDLEALNAAIEVIEQPYPLMKSDVIPKQLLNAEPGSKLYPHLIKKIEVVCKRSALDIEQRCADALRGQLLQAGLDPDLDHRRHSIASDYRKLFEKHALKYTSLLSLSDHSPVFASIPMEAAPSAKAWKVFTWNVLEFPKSDDGGSKSITDGVNPVCGQLISALNNRKRKRADEHSMLLSGMSLKKVINYHVDAVVDLVRCALAGGVDARADVAMLQELNRETVARLREACESSGLHYTFSPANDDESKCDAITAVISNMPLTEHKNVTVQEGNKIRQFAAGKILATWFVSCHMPMDESQAKKKKGNVVTCDGDVAAKAVTKIIEEVFVKSCAKQLVIGGDWNTDLLLLFNRLSKPEAKTDRCGKTISLHAPPHDTETCLGVEWPIDGFLRVS